jgi:hypothetical protein
MAGYELVLHLNVRPVANLESGLMYIARSSDRLAMRWLGEVVSSSDVAIYQQRITGRIW